MPTIGQSPQGWKHDSANAAPSDWEDWRWQLRHSLRGPEGLDALLREHGVPSASPALAALVSRYRFQVSPYYLSLIDWDDQNDPIRRQCLPDCREMEDAMSYAQDPYEETRAALPPGVVHRFPDRVLLVATTNCAVYCRHCTRKNTLEVMPQADEASLDEAVAYIAASPDVREVLISGGDPLLLDTARLDRMLGRIEAVPHVEVIRVGTRVPVVLPMRIDPELVTVLRKHRPLWVNTQFNHPRELTDAAISACGKLVDAGIPVSNQCVLLKGVNDDLQTMQALCTALQRNLIRPYYVFQCDPVAGITHFRTQAHVGGDLQELLRANVGGLCLPRFVADIPGASGKIPLEWTRSSAREDAPVTT